MKGGAVITALFALTAIVVGAAFSWSLSALAYLVATATAEPIPERLNGAFAAIGVSSILVLAACGLWLFALVWWVRKLPRRRLIVASLVSVPFLVGAVPWGLGFIVSFW